MSNLTIHNDAIKARLGENQSSGQKPTSAPKITITTSGLKGGIAGGNKGKHGKRGQTMGWSVGSARRNKDFLQSVIVGSLPKRPIAFTLTVNSIPETAVEFQYLIKKLRLWLYRNGALADHWVIEWTEKGRPHIHGCVLISDNQPFEVMEGMYDLVQFWLKITKHLGTNDRGQDIRLVQKSVGWFEYVSKHASRGMKHYQREAHSMPKGWQKTGRMWGKGGDWPVGSESFRTDIKTYWKFRRLLKNYLLSVNQSKIKHAGRYNSDRVYRKYVRNKVFLRKRLKNNKRKMSEVQGINDWVPDHVSYELLSFVGFVDLDGIVVPENDQEELVHTKLC